MASRGKTLCFEVRGLLREVRAHVFLRGVSRMQARGAACVFGGTPTQTENPPPLGAASFI